MKDKELRKALLEGKLISNSESPSVPWDRESLLKDHQHLRNRVQEQEKILSRLMNYLKLELVETPKRLTIEPMKVNL